MTQNEGFLKSYVLDIALMCLENIWPDALVETCYGTIYPIHHRIPFGIVDEFFIFMTPAFRETWFSKTNTMVQLICGKDELTVVLDDSKDPMMYSFLSELRNFLRVSIGWNGPFSLETMQMLP